MALPVISQLPPAPSRLDAPAVFVPRADAFLGALPNLQVELNAYAAALPAYISGTDFSGNSTTSTLIGTGSKVFTANTGKQWQIGQPVRVAYTTTPANYMDGQVTAYNTTTGSLTVNVTTVGGSGTFALWTISLIPGAGGSYASLTGAETLTNKTLTAPVIATMVSGGFTITVPAVAMTLLGRAETATVTNKTIDFGGNTITMTTAQLNAALSDGDIATLAGTETLSGKTMTAPTINGGTLRGDVAVSDGGTIGTASVGFRGVPASANVTGTLALADNGKYIDMAGNWTIPANAIVAFPDGAVVEFMNDSATPRTISITSDTLRWSGTTSTGTRTVAAYGRAWVQKKGASTWYAGGDLT